MKSIKLILSIIIVLMFVSCNQDKNEDSETIYSYQESRHNIVAKAKIKTIKIFEFSKLKFGEIDEGDSTWIEYHKYDTLGREIETVNNFYGIDDKNRFEHFKTTHVYDSTDFHRKLFSIYNWKGSKEVFRYDSIGNIIEGVEYDITDKESKFYGTEEQRNRYEYDRYNRLIKIFSIFKQSGSTPDLEMEYTYKLQGQDEFELVSTKERDVGLDNNFNAVFYYQTFYHQYKLPNLIDRSVMYNRYGDIAIIRKYYYEFYN